MSNAILNIQDLSKTYDGKSFALKDCSFVVERGTICAIVGESGSGKSTLLRLIAGLERPTNGAIEINGVVMSNNHKIIAPQKRGVGMVFQDYALFPHLTVAQNISFSLKGKQDELVKELLSLIKMEEYGKAYPNELSGGQEQRVALARTLALQPELLLLDEPFSNLDATIKSDLRNQIKQIVTTRNQSLIFITHDLSDAIDIADDIIYLDKGHIIQHSNKIDFSKQATNKKIISALTDLRNTASKIIDW